MLTNRTKIAIITVVFILLIGAYVMYKNKTDMIQECSFFQSSEFDSPDAPGSGKNMHHSTLMMLCEARKIAGIPFKINSGFRTVAHNKKVGGVVNSAHLKGYAIDIATPAGKHQETVVRALRLAGFRRFGVYANFVHADNDPTKKQFVAWGINAKIINPFNYA